MGDSPSPPTPINPTTAGEVQTQANKMAATESQAGSMVNQNTPFGSLQYSQTGTGPNGIPMYTANTQLSPQMQAIVSALQSGVTGQLNNANYGGTNAASTIGGMTSGTTKDLLDKEVSYLNPFFTQQQENLDAQLRNQGIDPSNPAYTRAMNNLGQTQNQSVTGFLAQAEPAAYQQATSSYLLPLGISSAEMGLMNPNMVSSSLINPPQLNEQPANYIQSYGQYDQAQQAAYQAQVQQQQAMMSGLFGIPTAALGGWAKGGFAGLGGGGAGAAGGFGAFDPGIAGSGAALDAMLLPFSDRRVKQNISQVGRLDNGLPVYLFQYKGDPIYHIGLIAQDVEQIKPEAVVEVDGLKRLRYELAAV